MTSDELRKLAGETMDWARSTALYDAAIEIDRLTRRVAELEWDVQSYRETIGVCSGSCRDHKGNIWEASCK